MTSTTRGPLGLLLKSPELDLKLAVGDYGKREYRAKLLAKFLKTVGHGNVSVGMGVDVEPRGDGPQAPWVKDFELSSLSGKGSPGRHRNHDRNDHEFPSAGHLDCHGPMPNVAAALTREPRDRGKGPTGRHVWELQRGYDGSTTVSAEWNVKADPGSCQRAFTAPWESRLRHWIPAAWSLWMATDTTDPRFKGADFPQRSSRTTRIWSKASNPQNTVAETRFLGSVRHRRRLLACSQELCKMRSVGIRVTDDGFTRDR